MNERQAKVCLGVILGLWLVANLATLERSPTVWCDEVMFAEPAVRCLAGQGFTATSWPAPAGAPAVLNGPLYSLLLVPWLWLWGVGPVAARSFGLLLTGLSALLLWRLACRSGAVRAPPWRLAGIGVFLCAAGVTWGYRSGRYDPLGLLLMVTLVASLAPDGQRVHGPAPAARRALTAAVVAGVLPFAGLYLVPCALLFGVAAVVLGDWSTRRRLAAPASGLVLGVVLLGSMHVCLGTWELAEAFVRAQRGPGLWARLGRIPASYSADPSLLPILALLLFLCLHRRLMGPRGAAPASGSGWFSTAGRTLRDPLVAGLLAALSVPAWMAVAGRYAAYYGWMAFVPALGAALHAFEPGGPLATRRSLTAGVGALALVLAAGAGLPLRLAACALEWRQRDYAPVERLVQAHLRPDDIVLTSTEAYYPVVRHCREVLLPWSVLFAGTGIPPSATALIGGDELREAFGELGDQGWMPVASYAAPAYSLPVQLGRTRWYALTVWRRR